MPRILEHLGPREHLDTAEIFWLHPKAKVEKGRYFPSSHQHNKFTEEDSHTWYFRNVEPRGASLTYSSIVCINDDGAFIINQSTTNYKV